MLFPCVGVLLKKNQNAMNSFFRDITSGRVKRITFDIEIVTRKVGKYVIRFTSEKYEKSTFLVKI